MTLFSRAAADSPEIADSSMICPRFGAANGGTGEQASLTEGECI
ncbi:hypothetical protein QFZ27_001521 [Inquilinus ginsengisoli]